jgi:hypothetical protein
MRRIITTFALVIAAFFAFYFYWNSDPEDFQPKDIQSEFDRIAETGKPVIFSKYRLICFSKFTRGETSEYAAAAKASGINLDKSLSACGVGGSCCELAKNSDASGIIGLVQGEEVRCVAFWKFGYVLEGKRSACIEPSRLKISREVFKSTSDLPGGAWRPQVGDPYYKIEERQP